MFDVPAGLMPITGVGAFSDPVSDPASVPSSIGGAARALALREGPLLKRGQGSKGGGDGSVQVAKEKKQELPRARVERGARDTT